MTADLPDSALELRSTVTSQGTLELSLHDVPVPTPATNEVLVRVEASPINPSDLLMVRGVYGRQPPLPAVPGFEGVGVRRFDQPAVDAVFDGLRRAADTRRDHGHSRGHRFQEHVGEALVERRHH